MAAEKGKAVFSRDEPDKLFNLSQRMSEGHGSWSGKKNGNDVNTVLTYEILKKGKT